MTLRLLFPLLIFSQGLSAQVFGPSSEEVKFSYKTEFVSTDAQTDIGDQAREHADYLFGILHSQELTENFNLNWDQVGGIGSPHSDIFVSATSRQLDDGSLLIRYSARGKILMHKKVAKKVLAAQSLDVLLPYDLANVYDPKCTDEHYDTQGDYWYFWNPYREGCEHLTEEPFTKSVTIAIAPGNKTNPKAMARLDLVRGNNDNGDLFSIYVVHGFNEDSSANDDGRINFEQLNEYLRNENFVEKVVRKADSRPLHLFTKSLELENGKTIQVEVRHLLANTAIDKKTKTFAQFMREAVYHGDVIFYGGHSGLGGNLDIASLEGIAGKFVFNPNKKQIFFFDSCSSYSYYLSPFAAEKTKAKIDIVTNALSSYFHTSQATTAAFFNALLTPEKDLSWNSILTSMEEPLSGGSYLINVGGL
jgi:hypothetical protein